MILPSTSEPLQRVEKQRMPYVNKGQGGQQSIQTEKKNWRDDVKVSTGYPRRQRIAQVAE